jgi:hypothetical protein
MKGDGLQKLVVDATEAEKATQRVLSRYGIEKPSVIAAQKIEAGLAADLPKNP